MTVHALEYAAINSNEVDLYVITMQTLQDVL